MPRSKTRHGIAYLLLTEKIPKTPPVSKVQVGADRESDICAAVFRGTGILLKGNSYKNV